MVAQQKRSQQLNAYTVLETEVSIRETARPIQVARILEPGIWHARVPLKPSERDFFPKLSDTFAGASDARIASGHRVSPDLGGIKIREESAWATPEAKELESLLLSLYSVIKSFTAPEMEQLRYPAGKNIDFIKGVLSQNGLTLEQFLESSQGHFTSRWANVSLHGDSSRAHSHLDSEISAVCFIDLGEELADGTVVKHGEREVVVSQNGGFSFLDPNIPQCCPRGPRYATTDIYPETTQGTILLFPSNILHSVASYFSPAGRPRITAAFNIAPGAIPGEGIDLTQEHIYG